MGAGPRETFRWSRAEQTLLFPQLEALLGRHREVRRDGLPRMCGGFVGWLSYDIVAEIEPRVPLAGADEQGFPDALLMDFDTVVAFDHRHHSVRVLAQARYTEGASADEIYAAALARIARTLETLSSPLVDERPVASAAPVELRPRLRREQFLQMVAAAQEAVRGGDCQQVVLSQRFDAELGLPPFELYRALRRINPSPYLFYFQDGEHALVGSSPETLVRLEGDEVVLRPIAGTRPRGADAERDEALAEELLADPKENAEHAMLVDLGRNDVGRVSSIGSVKVTQLRGIERYSHVLHMVSEVRGRLAEGLNALDVLRATFPAGTVSGSPKVRAMELIDALEPCRRGPYAGCAGYFNLNGDMEMAITIRTLVQSGSRISVQAGAGIVHDSVPESEYDETVNKARALFKAVAQAQSRSLLTRERAPGEAEISRAKAEQP